MEQRMVDPRKDLPFKKNYQANSWFAIGHFESADGHLLNWLYHIITTKMGPLMVVDSNFSVYDETTGEYHYEDKVYMPWRCEFREYDTAAGKGFSVKCPMGSISGDAGQIHVEATMKFGSVNCTMKKTREYIYNGGSGSFMTFLGGRVQQFSMSHLASEGKLTIGQKTYPITGESWFDCQWQFSTQEWKNIKMHTDWRWTWMDLNLDNGETISLWDMTDYRTKSTKAWATILHADDTQEVVEIEPIIEGADNYWRSPKSKNNYPTSFVVRIPAKNAELKVVTDVPDQEIVCKLSLFTKYESANRVSGTYNGQETTGYCYVEHLGKWK